MIVDFLDGSCPGVIDADLCVVGAGAAGIAITRSFIASNMRVCLLEGGGMSGEQRSQALYEGHSSHVGFDPGVSRMRVFGGSCNLWGGGCITFSRHDLGARDWVPHSGWPLDYAELEPHYRRAGTHCGIEQQAFADGTFLTKPSRRPLPLAGGVLVNKIFARSPLSFGMAYRDELARAANVTVLVHANLLQLHASDGGTSVREAHIGTVEGRRGVVRARQYVLACGGIENARILLLSDRQAARGLGNTHDLVGRYFMDHPSGRLGTIHTRRPGALTRPYERHARRGRTMAFPEISLSDAAQRMHSLLSGRVHPFAVEDSLPRGIRALRDLRAALRPPAMDEASLLEARLCGAMRNAPAMQPVGSDEHIARLALKVGLGAGDLARGAVRRWVDGSTVKSRHVALMGYFEQAPNPDSRIVLDQTTDALGQRRVRVDWRFTALDRHTYRTSAMLFGNELAQACGGRFEPEPWVADTNEDAPPQVRGTAHHLGTTRMAIDPREGVVDRDCRVHGIDNLHIAGSSVFPTGGWAFPTLTIVALSLRLADHLRGLLTVCAASGIA